jgi:hypothetical protein
MRRFSVDTRELELLRYPPKPEHDDDRDLLAFGVCLGLATAAWIQVVVWFVRWFLL